MNKLKVAVIGTNIGCTLHIRALRASGFEVTALVGRDPEKTAYRANHFGIEKALTSVDEAIDSDVDAIVVSTPPTTHHDFSMQAIRAGKHVICEKALTLDIGHAREMRDAANEAGLANMISHEFRWFAHNALARQAVRSGEIGDVIHVAAEFDHDLCARKDLGGSPDWWYRQDQGGGWLRNYNAHGIDLIRYMVGEFAAVAGTVRPGTDRGMTSDDSYAFAFLLENGAEGISAGTARAWEPFASTRITGTEAGVSLGWNDVRVVGQNGARVPEISTELEEQLRGHGPEVSTPQEMLPKMDDTHYVSTHSSDYGFAEMTGLTSAFASWIRDPAYRNPAIATFADGVEHVKVIDAVERSRKEGRWIDLEQG